MKKKILEITNTDFGVWHFLQDLMTDLKEDGWEVSFSCPRGPAVKKLSQKGFNYVPLHIPRTTNVVRALPGLIRLYVHFLLNRYDIVHVHTPIIGFYVRCIAYFAGVRRVIYTTHGFHVQRKLYILLERLAAWVTTYCFCVSQEDYRWALDSRLYSPSKISWISNGVDSQKYNPQKFQDARNDLRKKYGIQEDQTLFVFVGRIVREKGVLDLVEAFFKLVRQEGKEKSMLMIVGDTLPSDYDAIGTQLDHFIEEHQLSRRVLRVGYQSPVQPFLSAADIFILPSHREGMPISIIEAMMMELPVIASDIRGCREEVVDGQTGILFPKKSVDKLLQAMLKLSDNPELKNKMGKAGRIRALEQYEVLAVNRRQQDIFNTLLRSSSRIDKDS